MAGDRILTLDDENFDDQVTTLQEPILVDFWAGWCSPCKTLVPTLEQIAEELAGKVHVAKIDVDENGGLANRFNIRSIPTLIVFNKGKVVDQIIGAAPRDEILRMLAKHV